MNEHDQVEAAMNEIAQARAHLEAGHTIYADQCLEEAGKRLARVLAAIRSRTSTRFSAATIHALEEGRAERPQFVKADELTAAFKDAPEIDYEQFRADVSQLDGPSVE